MNKQTVVFELDGEGHAGQTITPCGKDQWCWRDLPTKTITEKITKHETVAKADAKGIGGASIAFVLALWALKRTFRD